LRATASRYRPAGRFAFHYVTGKLRRDPVARVLFDLGAERGFGDVVDLGCGRGHFSACLLQIGAARAVIGIDCHAAHVRQATEAMRGQAFTGRVQDFSVDQAVPAADTVLLIDVLYQLGTEAQSALLRNAAGAARELLIIRTADPGRGLRSRVTRVLEIGFRRVWPHAGRRVNARPVQEMVETLVAVGFACDVAPCWEGTPFGNVVIKARKKALLF
jgi:SAM-dependent methyltransferase